MQNLIKKDVSKTSAWDLLMVVLHLNKIATSRWPAWRRQSYHIIGRGRYRVTVFTQCYSFTFDRHRQRGKEEGEGEEARGMVVKNWGQRELVEQWDGKEKTVCQISDVHPRMYSFFISYPVGSDIVSKKCTSMDGWIIFTWYLLFLIYDILVTLTNNYIGTLTTCLCINQVLYGIHIGYSLIIQSA